MADYTPQFGAQCFNNAAPANCQMSPFLGSIAVDADNVLVSSAVNNARGCPARVLPSRELDASDLVRLRYKVSGGTASFLNRWLWVRPIRVG